MKIKIISDGTKKGTKVINAETGERVRNVTGIYWELDLIRGVARAKLDISPIAFEYEGEVK